ncbi:hypothetical protein C5B92_06985 [Rathayibacter sp. AY1A4]|uniref:hypothetical protein n=1 Tax=Rathayibacter sp. AY1A4 TaxID=2080522 RepID=UPI000CE9040E|nr:hypothetical protein [Rathayibacter sp. AY1A4]PPF18253.1 hypothetical protein C5B92_06985 [Rathayibacter sp. AY1A4]
MNLIRPRTGRVLRTKVGGVLRQLWPQLSQTIRWGGRTWLVRTGTALSPGPNDFGGTSRNVAVESDGRMRLSIAQVDGVWTSAEVQDTAGSLGYGRYRWVYDMDVLGMDWKPVLGLFVYDDDPAAAPHFREIDIETTKWNWVGEPSRQWYSVHPTVGILEPRTGPIEPRMGEHTMSPASPYTGEFIWQPGQVYFRTLDANGVVLGEHTVTEGVQVPGTENVRMNLWLVNGDAPANGRPIDVYLHSFDFTPDVTFTQRRAAAVTDTFDDTYGWALRGGAAITGGELVLPSVQTYASATSGSVLDLRGSYAQIEVVAFPEGVGGYSQEALWFLRYDGDNFLLFFYSAGGLYVRALQNGVQTQFQIPAFDPAVHRWWRMAHAGSTLTFSTSPDGDTWTTRGTIPATMPARMLATLRLRLESGIFGDPSDQSTPFRVGQIGRVDELSLLQDTDGVYYAGTGSSDAFRVPILRDTDGVYYPGAAGADGGFHPKQDTDGVFYPDPMTED